MHDVFLQLLGNVLSPSPVKKYFIDVGAGEAEDPCSTFFLANFAQAHLSNSKYPFQTQKYPFQKDTGAYFELGALVRLPSSCWGVNVAVRGRASLKFYTNTLRLQESPLLNIASAGRSRLFTIHRSTCMLSEMSRAFGHLVE